jgi:hypothetical protein
VPQSRPSWHANALDKKEEGQNPVNMHMPKKSGKPSLKPSGVLATKLTDEQRKETGESGPQYDVAKYEIVGIEVKGVPNVRVSNHPIQQPAPPSPTPTPTPPTPPPPPGD